MKKLFLLLALAPLLEASLTTVDLPQANAGIMEMDRLAPGEQWSAFAKEKQWMIMDWDRFHPFPHRAMGKGLPLGLSEGFAEADLDDALRAFLTAHNGLFSGGKDAGPENLELAHLGLHGDIWYAHYRQLWQGHQVLESELTFRVSQEGLLLMAGSDLHTGISAPAPRLGANEAAEFARSASVEHEVIGLEVADDWVLLPMLGEKGFAFRPVWPVRLDLADAEQRWQLFIDAVEGQILWSWNRVRYLEGSLHGLVEEQQPSDADLPQPLPHLYFELDGAELVSDEAGNWIWPDATGDGPWSLSGSFYGRYAQIQNQAGPNSSFSLLVDESGQTQVVETDQASIVELDAYHHTTRVHDFIKNMDDSFTGLDEALPVRININQTCNAYWDGSSINFFEEGGGCPNTARVAGVVYHEYGHGINDRQYMQAGSQWGMTNGAMHEGLADVTAIYLQDESFVSPGWFIRDLDNNNRYPEHIVNQVHSDGLILGGAMYDLRLALGLEAARPYYHYARWGAPDDPDLGRASFEYFLEILVLDDDDSDLSNLTPNFELINDAFNAHGIGTEMAVYYTEFALSEPAFISDPMIPLDVSAVLNAPGFLVPERVEIVWWTPGEDEQVLEMTDEGDGTWTAQLPGMPWNTLLLYYARVINAAGVDVVAPAGAPENVYRTRFLWEAGLQQGFEEEGWASVINTDCWQWGTPQSGPNSASQGEFCWATGLSGNYLDNQLGRLILPAQEIVDEEQVIFSFHSWMAIEEGWDGGNLEVSINDGDWMVVTPMGGYDFTTPSNNIVPGVPAFTGYSDGWERVDVDLTDLTIPGDMIAIRFNFMSDGYVTDAGWFIDDLSFLGFVSPTSIVHEPLGDREDSEQEVLIEASFHDSNPNVSRFELFYRVDAGEVSTLQMEETDGLWSAVIPGTFWEQEIEYRLEAEGADGFLAYLPVNPNDFFRFRVGEDLTPPTVEWLRGPTNVPGYSALWSVEVAAEDNLELAASLVELQWRPEEMADWQMLSGLELNEDGLWRQLVDFHPVEQVSEASFRLYVVDAAAAQNEAYSETITVELGSESLIDDFENQLLPDWELEGVWVSQTLRIHDGERSLGTGEDGFYEAGAEGVATWKGRLDLRETNHPALILWESYFIETGDDEVSLEISLDEGLSWQLLAHRTGILPWTESVIPLDDYEGLSGMMLRFRFQADDDEAQPRIGYFADNLRIVNDFDTGLAPEVLQPAVFTLGQAWPNPFNPVTQVELVLASRMAVTAALYNVRGQRLRVIKDESMTAGSHTLRIDGAELASGIYFLQVLTEGQAESRKLMLLK
jgi:hypothetical protein